MPQSLVLPATGLMTDPGPFTAAPDGGMLEAQNVVILRPGVMEPRPGFVHFLDSTLKSNADAAAAMYIDPSSSAFVWATSPWIIRKNGSSTVTGPSTFISGKIRTAGTGGRALFTSENGVCTLPGQLASPAQGSSTIAYRAGMPVPHIPFVTTGAPPMGSPASAAWLAAQTVAYRLTLRRTLADGTIVESAPSQRILVSEAGAGVAVRFSVDAVASTPYYAWAPTSLGGAGYDACIAGDLLCLYRSTAVAFGTIPSDEMRLRAVFPYSAADNSFIGISMGYRWYDMLPDSEWNGPALYTNSTQEGALLGNYRPQYARDIALYKGMTFYAGAKSAQRVTLQLRRMNTSSVADFSQMISSQNVTGSITLGSPNITAISAADEDKIFVGQVVTTSAGTPGVGDARFPANTTILSIAGGVAVASANALSTAAGTLLHVWDWIEADGRKLYHDSATNGFDSGDMLETEWAKVAGLQLRVQKGPDSSAYNDLTLVFEEPDPITSSFVVKSSKPFAWDRYVDSVTGVTSEQDGGIAELQWSKTSEPEHVPLPYRTVIGDASSGIRRVVAVKNSLLVFKDDGLFQIFGDTPTSLNIELLDRTILIPTAKDQTAGDEPSKWIGRFDDRVFAMTTRGPMAVTDAGAMPVGAPILESLRRRFIYAFGAFDESLRAMMVDTQSRRVGFFYDIAGAGTYSVGYVLDVETGAWTYWTLRRPVADFSSLPSFGSAAFCGSYFYGYILDDRTMLDDASVTVSTMPRSYEMWSGQSCTINSVTGGGPYTITIAAGSEWTPVAGDILVRSGTAHEVTSVTSATVFESDTQPTTGSADFRESYEARCVWLARAEGNVGTEKHRYDAVFPFEIGAITNRMKFYSRGYRNPAPATETFFDTSQTIGVTPWLLVPLYKRASVPSGIARDWAHQIGFTLRQAGCWFSTAGVSLQAEQVAAPNKAAR